MKKTFTLLTLLLTAAVAFGQSSLDDRVSISFDNLTITEALYTLIDQADADISFPNNIIPSNRTVNFTASNRPLREVLEKVLSNTGLDFRQVGLQVIIFEKNLSENRRHTISGFVRDLETGERIIGATIYDAQRGAGTYTNDQGHFSITLTEGESQLEIYSLGYDSDTLFLKLEKNQVLDISLSPSFLAEVVVETNPDSVLLGTGMSSFDLNISQVSKLPALGGEPDILRIAYTLPGIQVGADGFGGISVRGGNVDQNLFLLDGVPVYNATHGIGFFSIYNSSAVRSAKVLKGAFPAKYGGRLSSVWDIQTKDGNSKEFQGEIDLGLSTGKITLESPFAKGKGSVFVSGRRAFFDFFTKPITQKLRRDRGVDGAISYYFYDVNFKANFWLSKKDQLYFSYYRGRDYFSDKQEQTSISNDSTTYLVDDETVDWGNNIAALRWNHHFSDKLFGTTSFTFSEYLYESQGFIDLEVLVNDNSILRDILIQKYNSNIEDMAVKLDFDHSAFSGHQIEFGGSVTWHNFRTSITSYQDAPDIDDILLDTLGQWARQPLKSVEFDAYVQDEMKLGDMVSANLGLRLSALSVEGQWHFAPQPRASFQFFPLENLTLNTSAGRMTQFLHLLTPSSLGLPKDLWVTATDRIPPQHAWQFTLGGEQKFRQGMKLGIEGYYRKMDNLLIFKESTVENITSYNWQNKVSIGEGRGYGVEFLLTKEREKFSGWISYTLGWADRKFPADINRGNRFPTKLDRRHNLSLQTLYKFNEKWDASLGFSYASGTAFNLPTQSYRVIQPPGGLPVEIEPVVSPIDQLNDKRLKPYHRLDVSVNHHFWQRSTRHSLKFGFYNIYNRKNPLYLTVRQHFKEGEVETQIVQVSLLPIFPTLRYSMEFK